MLDKTDEIHKQMLIGGEWVDSASGETIAVENPGDRTILGHVPRGDAEDVERAVRAAAHEFESWSRVTPRDRGKLLLRIAEDLEGRTEELARMIAAETGNALRTQARPEAALALDMPLGTVASRLHRARVRARSKERRCRSASRC